MRTAQHAATVARHHFSRSLLWHQTNAFCWRACGTIAAGSNDIRVIAAARALGDR